MIKIMTITVAGMIIVLTTTKKKRNGNDNDDNNTKPMTIGMTITTTIALKLMTLNN